MHFAFSNWHLSIHTWHLTYSVSHRAFGIEQFHLNDFSFGKSH